MTYRVNPSNFSSKRKKNITIQYKAWKKYSVEDQEKITKLYNVKLEGYLTREQKRVIRRKKVKNILRRLGEALAIICKELMKDRKKKTTRRKRRKTTVKRRRRRRSTSDELARVWGI